MAWRNWEYFDKFMCGKWTSDKFTAGENEYQTFLTIEQGENEVVVRYNYNFPDSLNTAFYTESSYDSLYFFHNDRQHRAQYILTLTDENTMKCQLTAMNSFVNGSFSAELTFTRTEALTDEERKAYSVSNKILERPEAKIDLLKEYAAYGDISVDCAYEFKFDERDNMADIIEANNLDALVEGKSDFGTVITLLHWFCSRYRHGDIGHPSIPSYHSVASFADKNDGRTNCRGLALALSQLLRAFGIKAYHLTCMPYENPFNDCHVIVSAYIPSLSKQIMLDPSCNLYLKNKDGEVIGIDGFRDALLSDSELIPNPESTQWGDRDSAINMDEYRDYMAKNLIRITRYATNNYGSDGGAYVTLIPQKYMDCEAKKLDTDYNERFSTSRETFWEI